MPAIIAHHLFGREAYERLRPIVGESNGERNAFLLGNIGPDPLFCLKALPSHLAYRTIGTTMHSDAPAQLLLSIHRRIVPTNRNTLPGETGNPLRAFSLGFLCHYLLDSIAHPLVFAQQNALSEAHVTALGRECTPSELHALIETKLDEHLLLAKLGKTVDSFSPAKETLRCERDALAGISRALSTVAKETYDITMPDSAYATSVRAYRVAQQAIDSKRGGFRSRFDYARIAGSKYLHVQALTHSAEASPSTNFTNNDHVPWPHPFQDRTTISESFDDLYEQALSQAMTVVPRFAQIGLGPEDLLQITRDVNFYGERVSVS